MTGQPEITFPELPTNATPDQKRWYYDLCTVLRRYLPPDAVDTTPTTDAEAAQNARITTLNSEMITVQTDVSDCDLKRIAAINALQLEIDALPNTAPNISGKEDKSNSGIPNGYCPLDGSSLVPIPNVPIIPVANGGTGSGVLATARTNLGLSDTPTKFFYAMNQQANNTGGGTFTSGSWQTMPFLTSSSYGSSGSGVSLVANQFTLQIGNYQLDFLMQAFQVDSFKCRLRNVTDSTDNTGVVSRAGAAEDVMATAFISCKFNVSGGPKVFEIQGQCQTTKATTGLGVPCNFGDVEIYSFAKFQTLNA